MNNININELIEQLTDEIRLSKYKTWDSALVKGDNGLYHAITTDEDVILSTEDNSKETSWLCDYIELVCPENIQIILDALEAAQQYAKSRDEENQDLMLTIGRLRVEREQLEASQPVVPDAMPMQPIIVDEYGTYRFKANAIVSKLQEVAALAGYDLNAACRDNYSDEDWMQLAQLIGYSITGYSELSYVSDESYSRALSVAPALQEGK